MGKFEELILKPKSQKCLEMFPIPKHLIVATEKEKRNIEERVMVIYW